MMDYLQNKLSVSASYQDIWPVINFLTQRTGAREWSPCCENHGYAAGKATGQTL